MIIITRAKPADSHAIRNLEKEAHGEDVTSRYDAALIARFGYAYIAKENERIIGAITAWQTRNGEVKINDWVVHPEYRRRGIGEKLYLKLILETKGKTILSLVDVTNIASMKAHGKMGFKAMATIQDAYHMGKGEEQVLWKLENKE
ncbi:MAG TPA: GNAT family N-acetyltransferase [Candidatus Nanoarchaeia archaeon]|nr:GNAT family N-acetyltransferase [Candidatus Nanoarchaeia archaeon]